ncbi:LysR family transcriptional regulator [Aquabacterium sp. J223]|uniref:LysR family transcriptional regulator n=1 Tax=Aquabacterium sp. J223 TaxID=2898431 RepID=UPI0021AE0555|nr:LysR family transcriptional regulator [Aquabacterium sp. J223]UUX95986.1 LysR family transcriptional regulator [Aquabacterium sp. J223]
MDRLHSMRVFARVVELGSFAAAARDMGLSPAVVTRLVADLEQHLGARLINRTTRRLALTEAGADYLQRVQDVLDRIEEAENVARDAGTELAGTIRLATGASFAAHALAPVLRGFLQRYPKVVVDLHAFGSLLTTPEDEFDLTILVGPLPPQADFVARRLASTEIVACASPQYLASHPAGPPRHPDDLQRHESVVPVLAGVPREWRFERRDGGGPPVMVTLTGRLRVHHADVVLASAVAGAGIANLPSYVAAPALASGQLQWVLSGWRQPSVGVWAGLPTRRYLPLRIRVLVDWLVQAYGGEEADPWLKASPARG